MLEIKNLTKRYGDRTAVDDLSLVIESGKICGFIGRNGAGKTTTLKSVSGILQFDGGEVYIGGKSLKEHPVECKKRMAYIPDNPDLYDFMTGIKYLNFVADVYGVSVAERATKIQKYAAAFDMTDDLDQLISSYSHGMKQKLAVISALIHTPDLLIMDEPFVGLDPLAAHRTKEMMREICDRGGSILFSTHVLEVAQRLCDDIAIIKDGKLVVHGSTAEVLKNNSLENVFLELEGEKC